MERGSKFREQQKKWLQIAHKIAGHLIYPCALIDSVSPACFGADQEVEQGQRKIEEVGAELDGIVGELEGQEYGEDGFCSAALLESVEEIRRAIRISVALLVLGRLFPFLGLWLVRWESWGNLWAGKTWRLFLRCGGDLSWMNKQMATRTETRFEADLHPSVSFEPPS